MSRWVRGAIFLVSATITCVFFINFCATVYQCGCQWLWGEAAAHCNIHQAHARHCPWCEVPYAGHGVTALMVASQAVISFGPFALSALSRLVAALAAFPVVGAVMALVLGWYTGYWN